MTEELLTEIKAVVPNGWCSKEKASHLYSLIREHKPKLSIEIGAFSGSSLIPIGIGHKDNNSGVVLGIDTWSAAAAIKGHNDQANDEWWKKINFPSIYAECNNAIDHFQLNDYCGTVRLDSVVFGGLLLNASVGFIHQDGNHSEEVTCEEVNLYYEKLETGGIWVADDCRWPTVLKSISILERLCEYVGEFPNGTEHYKVFRKR